MPGLQGNAMLRGISGGQKKRVTTGEMLVGPMKVLFADEVRASYCTQVLHAAWVALLSCHPNWKYLGRGICCELSRHQGPLLGYPLVLTVPALLVQISTGLDR